MSERVAFGVNFVSKRSAQDADLLCACARFSCKCQLLFSTFLNMEVRSKIQKSARPLLVSVVTGSSKFGSGSAPMLFPRDATSTFRGLRSNLGDCFTFNNSTVHTCLTTACDVSFAVFLKCWSQ